MSNIYIFGHKCPDNDCIMSSVVLAQLLNQIKLNNNTYEARRLGQLPAESAKIFEDYRVTPPELLNRIPAPAEGEEPQKVILCDHNEVGQTVDGIEDAVIVGVVDHHRIGNFCTAAPLAYLCMPWGSSCTLVYRLFKDLGVTPSKAQVACLLSAMMTDTLCLKSPTTTDVDRFYAAEMGEILGVDATKFGMEVLMSRPSGSYTPVQMVTNDIKEFDVSGRKLLIGQYETIDRSRALGMIPEIREAMRAYLAERGADGIVMCLTDIMDEGSQVLLEGDTEVAQAGLAIVDDPDGVWMPGVLSRKKQVAAPILAAATPVDDHSCAVAE